MFFRNQKVTTNYKERTSKRAPTTLKSTIKKPAKNAGFFILARSTKINRGDAHLRRAHGHEQALRQ